jgi:hypothetical protein
LAAKLIENEILLNLGATNMKKILPVAVLSALAGVNGAQAVHLNPDGLGEVLLYPYYTVEGSQDTYIQVVNTTMHTKAVKVRFREALNSQEVLDFNLYLSPYDHWSAVITRGDTDAAVIITADNSCTVPNALSDGNAISFRNTDYLTDSQNGLDRTREGYVEMIDMGVVGNAAVADPTRQYSTFATHVQPAGVPASCAGLQAAWNAGGYWSTTDQRDAVTAAIGGLYGYEVIIDSPEGTAGATSAVALDDFDGNTALHFPPGTSSPGLGDSAGPASVINGTSIWTGTGLSVASGLGNGAIDTVTAVLSRRSIVNDFILEPSLNAGTDWTVVWPTRFEYIMNPVAATALTPAHFVAKPPFVTGWNPATSKACEPIDIVYYNREELGVTPDEVDFSPAPPGDTFELCAEANVLTFDSSDVLEASSRGLRTNLEMADSHPNGWLSMSFNPGATYTRAITLQQSLLSGQPLEGQYVHFVGLPTIGFAFFQYQNGTSADGVLRNYAAMVRHKATRSIWSDNASSVQP